MESRLLRATEELVTATRLEQIAKDNKSIGSILDTRIIQPLDEIKFQTKKAIKVDIEKRLQARRGGRSESDIVSKANLAVESFKDKGINVGILAGNYDLEERIWKDKSQKIIYSQRRKFQQPLLEEFLNSLTPHQKAVYNEKTTGALIRLSDKFRKECRDLKVSMDLNGIFHPEANAHRAHCLYLIKLNKGICAETIEDPILKEMLEESLTLKLQSNVELTREEKLFLDRKHELKDERVQGNKVLVESRRYKSSSSLLRRKGAKNNSK
jgi:hypothetical protein